MTGSLFIMDEAADFDPRIWETMLKDYYSGKSPLPAYRPYIPIQWVDAKKWGRDIGKSGIKQAYLEYELEKLDDTERKG
jgi:hypothetical protein